jgi:hypothetical protein
MSSKENIKVLSKNKGLTKWFCQVIKIYPKKDRGFAEN